MKSSLHEATPNLSVIDPRGLTIRGVAYHRAVIQQPPEARVTRQVFDAAGRVVAHRDPRFAATSSAPNLTTVFSLSARPLLSNSVDAGWCLRLFGATAEIRCEWDGRHNRRLSEYDDLLRPVAIIEQAGNAPPCVTERFTYADCSSSFAAHNLCASLIRHDDPAGCRTYADYGLLGQPLAQTQCFLSAPVAPDWPQSLSGREALLERDDQGVAQTYTTRWQYNALATVLSQCDALGNTQSFHYDIAGQLALTSLKPADQSSTTLLLQDRSYNAFGQVQSETFGNGVSATAIYSPVDGRLQRLRAVKANKVLQHLSYTYDPVGNVMSIEDAAQPTDWFAGEQVDPVNRYVYDTLGQLVQASGRESVLAGIQPGLPGLVLPGGGDASRLRNYTQTFSYDAAGNLLSLKHGQLPQRTMKVDALSNRSLYQVDASNPPDISNSFDANGNMLGLDGTQTMHWDVHNQLQCVTQIMREDSANDDEVYVYGTGGQRQRKVRVQHSRAVAHTAEVRYLPGLEIRTNTATGEALQVCIAHAGGCHVRYLHWRTRRKTPPAAQWRYTLSNHVGSSTLELDDQGAVVSHEDYYPYGGTAWWAARNNVDASQKVIRYSGKERDASGLYYYGLRYYAPWLQRWINPDPMGIADGLNLFCMVHGNPIGNVDLQGTKTTPAEIAKATGAGMARDTLASSVAAGLRYGTMTGLNSIPVNAASIIGVSVAGALFGGFAGAYVGAGLGAQAASAYFGNNRIAKWSGAIAGGLLGATVGALPSVLGCLSAMNSLNTDQPVQNTAAVSQIGATVSGAVRQVGLDSMASKGPKTVWNSRPPMSAVAMSSLAVVPGLAGFGAIDLYASPAVAALAGTVANDVVGSAVGSVIRGLHSDSTYEEGSGKLTNPLAKDAIKGTAVGIATRAFSSAAGSSLGIIATQSGLDPSSLAGKTVAKETSLIGEARLLASTYMVDGYEALGYLPGNINQDPSTMKNREQWIASNDDPDVALKGVVTLPRY